MYPAKKKIFLATLMACRSFQARDQTYARVVTTPNHLATRSPGNSRTNIYCTCLQDSGLVLCVCVCVRARLCVCVCKLLWLHPMLLSSPSSSGILHPVRAYPVAQEESHCSDCSDDEDDMFPMSVSQFDAQET